jgi:hypothetical protein
VPPRGLIQGTGLAHSQGAQSQSNQPVTEPSPKTARQPAPGCASCRRALCVTGPMNRQTQRPGWAWLAFLLAAVWWFPKNLSAKEDGTDGLYPDSARYQLRFAECTTKPSQGCKLHDISDLARGSSAFRRLARLATVLPALVPSHPAGSCWRETCGVSDGGRFALILRCQPSWSSRGIRLAKP